MSDAAWMIAGLYVMVAAGFAVGCVKELAKEDGRASLGAIIIAAITTCSVWPFLFAANAVKNAAAKARANDR